MCYVHECQAYYIFEPTFKTMRLYISDTKCISHAIKAQTAYANNLFLEQKPN